MWAIIVYIKQLFAQLFARVPPSTVDEHCPYCHGIGYDSSGLTCTCVKEKK